MRRRADQQPNATRRHARWARMALAGILGGLLAGPAGYLAGSLVAFSEPLSPYDPPDFTQLALGGLVGGAMAGLVLGLVQQLLLGGQMGGGWLWPNIRRWGVIGTLSAVFLLLLLLGQPLAGGGLVLAGALTTVVIERRQRRALSQQRTNWALVSLLSALAGMATLVLTM